MITFFNNLGQTWVAKIILGALALSMLAFWGLGGLANVSSYDNSVVSVGDESVSPQELMNSFEKMRQDMSRYMTGVYISPEQAIQNGMLDKVVQDEVAKLTHKQIMKDFDLTASNEAVQKYVENNPVFQDTLGQFDKNLFYAYLMQHNITETQLANQLKDELALNHLLNTVEELAYTPDELVKLAYQHKNEKRDIDVLTITPAQLKIDVQPTEDDLKNYYEAYAEDFMIPELRSLSVVTLTPATIRDLVAIDENDLQNAYDAQKESFVTPEKRDLYQAFFDTKESAQSFYDSVSVDTFIKMATDTLKQDESTTHFGKTAKGELMAELADPVFEAKVNTITTPIQSSTGWHVFMVKEIIPAVTREKDEVIAEIKNKMIDDKAYALLEDMANKLEDSLGAGNSLDKTASELKLNVTQAKNIDVTGKNMDLDIKNSDLLQEIFTLNQGEVSSLIHHNNGYIIAQVDAITPVSMQELADVKDEVKAIFKKEKQNEIFESVVAKLEEKAKNGAPLNALAKSNQGNFSFENFENITRDEQNATLTPVLADVFAQNTGAENITAVTSGEKAVLIDVKKITPAVMDDETKKVSFLVDMKKTVGKNLASDVFVDYINTLGVKINQQLIGQIFSVYKTQK